MTERGPGPPFCRGVRPYLLVLLFLLVFVSQRTYAEKSKFYYMQSLCKNHFLQQLYRKIDGAVLWSQNERNLDCVITFQTHSILQRFMLRFDMLQLDCNDHLFVYDGAHAVGTHKADLSCRNTKQSVGVIFTRTNFVTLKYKTDNWGTESNGFKLVITAVKDPKHGCKDFRCNLREFCISADLICDGVDHCDDGSDETSSSICQSQETGTILGMEMPWFVVGAVSGVLVLCACAVALALCACRRSSTNRHLNNSQLQLQQVYGSNGSAMKQQQAAMLNQQQHHMELSQQTELLPENWWHPVGLEGAARACPIRCRRPGEH